MSCLLTMDVSISSRYARQACIGWLLSTENKYTLLPSIIPEGQVYLYGNLK